MTNFGGGGASGLARSARRGQRWHPLVFLVACFFPSIGVAQQDAGVLRMYQAGVEVGREEFHESGRISYDMVSLSVPRQRIVSEVEHSNDGRPIRAEARFFSANGLTLTVSSVLQGGSWRTTTTPVASAPSEVVSSETLEEILPDQPGVAGIVHLLQRAPRQNRVWQVGLLSDGATAAMRVSWRGDTALVNLDDTQIVARLGADGEIKEVLLPSGQAQYVIAVSPVRYERFVGGLPPPLPSLEAPVRDYTAPAGAPYEALDVQVSARTAAGAPFSVGCTLTKPKSGGPIFPAVITINGSGPGDRDDDTSPLLTGFHLYRQVADRLAIAGIVVLRCDKRGFEGERVPPDPGSPLVNYVRDAAAELEYLRTRSDIDPAHLGVIGHSLGGMIAPRVAADDPQVAALVVLAGPALPFASMVRDQFLYPVEQTPGLASEQRDIMRAQAISDATNYANRPQLRWWRDYDPVATARVVHQPVLILHGEADRNVNVGNADTLATGLRAGGNTDVTVRKFARLNHFLLISPSGTGSFEEYGTITNTAVPMEVLDAMANWLVARLRR